MYKILEPVLKPVFENRDPDTGYIIDLFQM
jgi:hypothetical protein